MEPKYSKIFSKSAESYCKLNNIEDVDGFIKKCFDTGFNIEKYGLLEKPLNEGEKDLIKEVIVEKRVEIPVEVIKEVEKIVEVIREVPVDRIIEKEIYITDDNQVNELGEKITKLEDEMSKKDEELDELRRNLDIKLDDTQTKMLQETLQKLRKEILDRDEKIKELERINQELKVTKNPLKGFFMRGSNLNDTI
jgi:predicted RNase H-like nuclease (RuvC/YqgF family)